MDTSAAFLESSTLPTAPCSTLSPTDDRAEFVEEPAKRTSGARGIVLGMLLGAGIWGAILAFAGVIKL